MAINKIDISDPELFQAINPKWQGISMEHMRKLCVFMHKHGYITDYNLISYLFAGILEIITQEGVFSYSDFGSFYADKNTIVFLASETTNKILDF
jgi:hypothetical protein